MYLQFGGENSKLSKDDFEENAFDCSLLYFSSSLFSLFVSLTKAEEPSAGVGGGAVRQSRLPWRIPASQTRPDNISFSQFTRAHAAMSLAPDHREELTDRLHSRSFAASLVANASQGIWNIGRRKIYMYIFSGLTGMPASKANCNSAMALKEKLICDFWWMFPTASASEKQGKWGENVWGENEVPSARASAQRGRWMYTWGNGTWQLDPQLWFLNSDPLASYFFCLVSYCQHWQASSLILPLIVLHVTALKWIKSKCFSWSIR